MSKLTDEARSHAAKLSEQGQLALPTLLYNLIQRIEELEDGLHRLVDPVDANDPYMYVNVSEVRVILYGGGGNE